MRLLPFAALFLVGCGSSSSFSSSGDAIEDPLAPYVGRECVVRGRPDKLGGMRENPVNLDQGMANDVSAIASGTLARVDDHWITVRQKAGTTTLIDREIVATLTFEGSETPAPPGRRP